MASNLPSVVSQLPNDVRNFLQRVRETLDGAFSGDNKFVSERDLLNGNIIGLDAYGGIVPPGRSQYYLLPPPAPVNVTATGALTTVILEWDDPLYANLAHAEIWRSGTDDLGTAVLNGTTIGYIYSDPVDAGTTHYYWVRFVSKAEIVGPYNAVSGVNGTTSADPAAMVALLSGKITATQLHTTLGSRINLIDAPVTGLVPISTANTDSILDAILRVDALHFDFLYERNISNATVTVNPATGEVSLLASANVTTDVEARLTNAEFELNAHDASIIATASTVTTHENEITVAQGQIATLENQIIQKVSQAYVDAALIDQVDGGLALDALANAMLDTLIHADEIRALNRSKTYSIATAEQNIQTNANALEASALYALSLSAILNNTAAALQIEASTRATADTATAVTLTTLQSSIDGNTAALQIEASTRAMQTGDLYAQYTVKLDVDGKVSGFGLASTGPAGAGSVFEIRADKFAIAAPSGVAAGSTPFVVTTSDTAINGVTVPAGTYIANAYISNGAIGNAQIGNLAVDNAKIANLSAAKLTAGAVAVGQYIQSSNYISGVSGWRVHGNGDGEFNNIWARGNIQATSFSAITLLQGQHIKQGQTAYNTGTGFFLGDNGSGTPVFSVGSPADGMTWDGSQLRIGAASVTGLGALATQSTVAATSVTGLASVATTGIALSVNGGGMFTGALSAASGTFSGALTADAINAVNTINLAGQAVTIPVSAYTSASSANTTAQTVSITSSGAPITVLFSTQASTAGSLFSPYYYTAQITFELRRNGIVITSGSHQLAGWTAWLTAFISGSISDTPGVGTHTYTIVTSTTYNSASYLGLLETKK